MVFDLFDIQALLEIVDFIQSGSSRISEPVQEELIRMIGSNIFRCLPPASYVTLSRRKKTHFSIPPVLIYRSCYRRLQNRKSRNGILIILSSSVCSTCLTRISQDNSASHLGFIFEMQRYSWIGELPMKGLRSSLCTRSSFPTALPSLWTRIISGLVKYWPITIIRRKFFSRRSLRRFGCHPVCGVSALDSSFSAKAKSPEEQRQNGLEKIGSCSGSQRCS